MMRKILSLLCICLVCCLMLCACSKKNPHEAKPGELVPVYEDDGTLKGYEKRFYNASGKLSRLDYYNTAEEYDGFVLYDYDSNGRVFQESTYGADGIGKFYYNYEYDDEGRIYRESYVTMKDGYTVSWFEEGEKQEVYSYDAKGNLISHQKLSDGEWVDVPEETHQKSSQNTAASSTEAD